VAAAAAAVTGARRTSSFKSTNYVSDSEDGESINGSAFSVRPRTHSSPPLLPCPKQFSLA
jgi:hypothetical protein